jgi:hypothetical protein
MSVRRIDVSNVQINRQGDHVEAAAPTHGGHCPDCPTRTTGPSWDLIESGTIKGTYGGGQCGGCGQLGQGWVHTGARLLPFATVDHEEFIEALKVECAGRRDEVHAVSLSEIRVDLAALLVAAIDDKPTHPYAEDDEAWSDWFDDHHVSWDNSGGDGPIFFAKTGEVSAWKGDPSDSYLEGVTVTAEDLSE